MAYLRGAKGTITGRTMDSPVLTTPALGTPSAGVMTNMTGAVEASLVDDAITLAKMAGGTDGNIISYDASGDPVAIATGDDGQVLTSAGAGAPPAFEAISGLGALTGGDSWRITAGLVAASGSSNIVTANWERDDTAMNGSTLGGMSESSGIFSFPSTGLWHLDAWTYFNGGITGNFSGWLIQITTDNSAYNHRAESYTYIATDGQHQNARSSLIFDVTDTSNHKCRMDFFIPASGASSIRVSGSSSSNHSGLTFIRLGDT